MYEFIIYERRVAQSEKGMFGCTSRSAVETQRRGKVKAREKQALDTFN